MILNLYAAASKYQINGLISICENRMMELIGLTNCIDIYRVADTFEAIKLKAQVMHYIVQNYADVCVTEQYKYIVCNYDKDEQCKTLLNEMNTAVSNCQTYHINCLGLIPTSSGTIDGIEGPPIGGVVGGSNIGLTSAPTGQNHRGNGNCTIS